METPTLQDALALISDLTRRFEQLEAQLAQRSAAPTSRPATALVTALMKKVAATFAKPDGFLAVERLTTTEIADRLQVAPSHLKPLGQALRAAGFIREPVRNGSKVEGRYPMAIWPTRR